MKSWLRAAGFPITSLSEVGGLPHIDQLTHDWLTSQDDHVPTSELFLSNIGMCPRKLILQKKEVTVDRGEHALWNRTRMFGQANNVADDVAEALHHAERLVAMEQSITHLLPEPWGGRFDILALYPQRRFWEVKSAHPNVIRYAETLPKQDHVSQALAYEVWAGEYYDTRLGPIIHNADRGGQNTSKVTEVLMPDDWLDFRKTITHETQPVDILGHYQKDNIPASRSNICLMALQMIELQTTLARWKRDDALPAPLERAPSHRTSKRGELYIPIEIYMDRDWRCRQCDYCDTEHCESPKGKTGVLMYDWDTNRWWTKPKGRPYLEECLFYIQQELHIQDLDIDELSLL